MSNQYTYEIDEQNNFSHQKTQTNIADDLNITTQQLRNYKLDGDTPELRKAAENSLNQLKKEFPDYKFSVQFGGGK
ncbi:hypothetical protein L8C07_00250 [Paenibacillus sp. CMAA1739]|uniref:hypothetical protein n=1 Tax=Paenibacillus ottowii TaxID=2315729 RepID=UPI0027313D77|nr:MULTISPECIES: hypothetical protein [Paenibacillus]MDP1512547.1 hypothetical protein [Paenibacillus ottowii]MEC4564359.1 hypothetical protein [Paenibacillus sp. CMAA1739]